MLFDEALHGLTPAALVAFTLNVYVVLLVRPVTVIGELNPVFVMQPGDDVTMYEHIEDGVPLQVGAVNETEAQRLVPAVAVPIVGA